MKCRAVAPKIIDLLQLLTLFLHWKQDAFYLSYSFMRYFYYWLESSFAGGCLGQSNEILQTSDTSENSLIDMTLLRSSDGNGDASNVTMKDGW